MVPRSTTLQRTSKASFSCFHILQGNLGFMLKEFRPGTQTAQRTGMESASESNSSIDHETLFSIGTIPSNAIVTIVNILPEIARRRI